MEFDARSDDGPLSVELVGLDTLVKLDIQNMVRKRKLVLRIKLDNNEEDLFLMFNRKPATGLNSGALPDDADKLVIVAQEGSEKKVRGKLPWVTAEFTPKVVSP